MTLTELKQAISRGEWAVESPHPGQYAIVLKDPPSPQEERVIAYIREFQPQDKANAAYIAHCANNFGLVMEAIRRVLAHDITNDELQAIFAAASDIAPTKGEQQ